MTRDLAQLGREFAEFGFVRLGPIFAPGELAACRARSDALMLGEIRYPGLFFQLDAASGRYEDLSYGRGFEGPSLAYRKLEKLELDPLFRALIEAPAYEPIVRHFIPGPLVIYRAALFNKAPRTGSALPFHQDGGQFWGVSPDPFLQIWTALDDATEERGALIALPGTHRRGLATPLGGRVPRALLEREPTAPVMLPARAGEAILIHNHLWHASGNNLGDTPRRALSVCYMSAEARCLRTRRAPRRFFPVFAAHSQARAT